MLHIKTFGELLIKFGDKYWFTEPYGTVKNMIYYLHLINLCIFIFVLCWIIFTLIDLSNWPVQWTYFLFVMYTTFKEVTFTCIFIKKSDMYWIILYKISFELCKNCSCTLSEMLILLFCFVFISFMNSLPTYLSTNCNLKE